MSIAAKLEALYPFSPELISRIDEIAQQQDKLTYQEFSQLRNIPDLAKVAIEGYMPMTIVDFKPQQDFDEREAIAYHLWHATGISPNALMRAGTLHAMFPDRRLIVFGNAGGPGFNTDKIGWRNLFKVFKGDLRPKVDPRLRYINSHNIDHTSHIGHSGGADEAAVSSTVAVNYDMTVDNGVFSETASGIRRSLFDLGSRFASTAAQTDRYVADAECLPLVDARKTENDLKYTVGLLRASNIASARSLALGRFQARLDEALDAQSDMKATVIWADESELVVDGIMTGITRHLDNKYPNRLDTVRLVGHKHNYVDNIYYHTAVMAHGLSQ